MEFQRTGRTLRTLEKKDVLTLEETLGVMTDILADVQTMAGESPDKLNTGDLRAAVTGMSMVGRMLLQIKKTKSEEFGTAADRKKRLDKIYDEIEQTCSEMDKAEKQIEEYSEKQIELEKVRSELAVKADRAQEISDQCKSIEEEIEKLSTVDLDELAEKKRQQQEKLAVAKDRFNDEYNEVERLKEIHHMLENDVNEKSEAAEELKKEIEEKRNTLHDFESMCVEYEEKLEELGISTDDTRKRADELKQQFDDSQNKIDELSKNELPELKEKLQKSNEELEAIQRQCDDIQSQIDEAQKENNSKTEELEQKKQKLQEEADNAKNSCEQLETDITNMTAEKESLIQKERDLQDEMVNIEAEIKQFKVSLQANEDLIQSHREELSRYRDITIPASMLTLKKREQTLDEYASRNNELKMQIAEKEEEISGLEKTVGDQQNELSDSEKKRDELTAEIDTYKQKLEDIRLRIGNLSAEKQKMMAEIAGKEEQLGMNDVEALKNKYDEVCRLLNEKEEQAQKLRGDIETKKQESAKADADIESIQNEMHRLSKYIDDENEKYSRMKQSYDNISAHRDDVIKKKAELKELLDSITSTEAETEIKACEGQLAIMQDAVDKLFPDAGFNSMPLPLKKEEAARKRRYFKEEIAKIRRMLDVYKQEYRNLIEAIETGVKS